MGKILSIGWAAFLLVLVTLAVSADTPKVGQSAVFKRAEMEAARWNDDATANCKTVTGTSQQFTIVDPRNSAYEICARGADVFLLAGSNPTATASVGGYSRVVLDGRCTRLFRFDCVDSTGTGPCDARKVAFIATATVTGASVCFLQYDPNL